MTVLALIVIIAILAFVITLISVQRQYQHTRQHFRDLWTDHVVWTRLYIISALQNLPDKAENAARLMQNQDEIGQAVAALYNQEVGQALAALLKEHIMIATQVISAAQTNNSSALTTAQAAWSKNGDDIAHALSKVTGASLEKMKQMMKKHLETTTQEVVDYIQANYEADIQAYEEVKKHILEMSDDIVDAIFRQQHPFLSRFLI